jgi:hypothetical protein
VLGAAFAHAARVSYPLSKDESFGVGKIAGEVGVRGSSVLAILPTLRFMI